MTLGERIRSIRESKGITQNTLAESVHVTSSYISRIEHGSSLPSLDLIQSIAGALDTPVQDILCDLFSYSSEVTISEKIKITVERFSPEKQQLLLDTLEYLANRLEKL